MIDTKILVADDDADDQLLLKTAFAENGADANLAFVGDGAELLEYLELLLASPHRGQFPEFIMLDLNMPRKSGKEALTEIKKHPVYRTIPVIIYTTTKDIGEIRRCYELGANSYIVKPSSFETMVTIVGTVLEYWLNTASIPITRSHETRWARR